MEMVTFWCILCAYIKILPQLALADPGVGGALLAINFKHNLTQILPKHAKMTFNLQHFQ